MFNEYTWITANHCISHLQQAEIRVGGDANGVEVTEVVSHDHADLSILKVNQEPIDACFFRMIVGANDPRYAKSDD